jgi:argininosuccinate lyase
MHEFNQSLKYDKRMYAADVKGSIAFSKALLKAGILNEHEQKEITRGLKQVEQEWAEGKVSCLLLHGDRELTCDSSLSRPTMRIFTLPTSDD